MSRRLDSHRKIAAGRRPARPALLLAALLASIPGWAGSQPAVTTVPVWQSGPAGLTRSIAVGDVDRDGTLDLVAGNLAQGNTLYLNEGTRLATGPAWTSGPTNVTLSVVLGDVDGDGFLDLICGNSVHRNTLYLNQGGVFGNNPVWATAETDITSALAVGDIDGNGGLDLVCGNYGQANTIHLNTGGTLSATADWSSTANDSTRGVALGDVDRDGDLDLVCGNFGANKLYVNNDGVLDTLATWSSAGANRTTGVALGDVDGDGDLDLVCSNLEQPNTVFENLGSTFATVPMWTSAPAGSSMSVAIGDIDYDGDLDLVFANEDHPNTVYTNVGGPGVFEASPSWYSTTSNATIDVCMADIDRDGDLDIVGANSNQPNTAYDNESPPYPAAAGWLSNPSNSTLGISVADLDDDGHPDLVCGNFGVNTAYRNDGTGFTTSPTWSSAPAALTADVALGDVNQDGYTDLVCGNAENPGQANTLYINAGGTLSVTPAWSSVPANRTVAVALGDVDGDDRLDLVCGNAGQANTVYLAEAGAFETTPSWGSLFANSTTDVMLYDVDGDGDLDLVCGNTGESNTMYRNDEGTLETIPAWSSGPTNDTGGIAVGDVDGDGDPDLACGNVGQSNTLYLNEGGTFGSTPFWSSEPTNRTSGVVLGDVDGDGDLDLICSNLSQANSVYINDGGALATSPIWLSSATDESEDAAAGDVDGDGDLDLVFGNELSPNVSYPGRKNPVFRGDTTDPTDHLANNGAFISRLAATETATNTVGLEFDAVDIESDPVWVALEYQFGGEAVWRPAIVDGATGVAGWFATSPTGHPDSLDWDITAVMFDNRDVVLRLSVIENPRRVSRIQYAATFSKNIGKLAPQRPEISPSTYSLDFPTVTVGDTVALDLGVTNSGNVDLVVDRVALPSVEMTTDVTGPFSVRPGSTTVVRVFLAPVLETAIAGSVEISSNDPLTPLDSVRVNTDIRGLLVTSRLLNPADTIPLGEAATVIVEPLPGVDVESGYLFHRPLGAQAFDSIPLGRSGGDFVAVVPGASVTEAGLEYYILVENSPVTNTDPPNAPDDSVYFRPVGQPVSVASSATFTDPGGYLEGRGINVLVALPQGASFVGGTLHYRESAAPTYGQIDLVEDPIPSATIPDSVVGPLGVEYWVEVQTLTQTLTDPPSRPAENPLSIPVIVPDLVEPNRHAAMTYRLFSIPLQMQGSILGSIADELGGADITQWRLFSYDAGTGSYVELPNDTIKTFTQGQSYWLISRGPHRIGSGPDRGQSALTDRPFDVALTPGYNLIANPFNFSVPWDSMMVDTLSMGDAQGVLVEPPMAWVPGSGLRDSVAALEPFDGYWVKNLSAATATLKVRPLRAAPSPTGSIRGQVAASTPKLWGIRIEVSSGRARDKTGYAGVHPDASNSWDPLDRSRPPTAPGRTVSVSFPHTTWRVHPDRYAHDVRGDYERLEDKVASAAAIDDGAWGHIWRFDVAKSYSDLVGGDEVVLTFRGVDSAPDEAAVYLIDNTTRKTADLRQSAEYRFFEDRRVPASTESESRFVLVVGSETFVGQEGLLPELPSRTALRQNRPNPFNPTTVIRYDVAAPTPVTLTIYDASGALVRRLYDGHRRPGVYEQSWDGKNEAGHGVASGIYFVRLAAGSVVETKKMVLLK